MIHLYVFCDGLEIVGVEAYSREQAERIANISGRKLLYCSALRVTGTVPGEVFQARGDHLIFGGSQSIE